MDLLSRQHCDDFSLSKMSFSLRSLSSQAHSQNWETLTISRENTGEYFPQNRLFRRRLSFTFVIQLPESFRLLREKAREFSITKKEGDTLRSQDFHTWRESSLYLVSPPTTSILPTLGLSLSTKKQRQMRFLSKKRKKDKESLLVSPMDLPTDWFLLQQSAQTVSNQVSSNLLSFPLWRRGLTSTSISSPLTSDGAGLGQSSSSSRTRSSISARLLGTS